MVIIGDTISMGSLKNKPPQPPVKRTKEESDERARSLKEFGTEDFTELNRSADAIFDTAWNVVKEDEPIHLVGSNELAERARSGDEDAYEEMYNRLQEYYEDAKEIHGLTYEDVMNHFSRETGENPYNTDRRKKLGKVMNQAHVVYDAGNETPVHTTPLRRWQDANKSHDSHPSSVAWNLIRKV
jgi:predicted lipid-binding transport protein (Tim44 family)